MWPVGPHTISLCTYLQDSTLLDRSCCAPKGRIEANIVNGMWSKGANIKFVNRGLTVASNGNTPLDVPSAGVAGLTLLSCGVGICKPIYCKSSFHELFVQPMGRTRSTSCTALCLKGPKWLSEAVARPKAA